MHITFFIAPNTVTICVLGAKKTVRFRRYLLLVRIEIEKLFPVRFRHEVRIFFPNIST